MSTDKLRPESMTLAGVILDRRRIAIVLAGFVSGLVSAAALVGHAPVA